MKNLVIVESPSKSHTIEKYLGDGYKVLSSKGHIRDLATSGKGGLGVDIENNFKPTYITMKGKNNVINELKKECKDVDHVILATDPDREGEAISWHLKEVLGLKDSNYDRVVFNEITEGAIKEAFTKPRKIDMELVKSQEARRILDRIIGFKLAAFCRYKTHGNHAGRVQSPTLKLIVDREREIRSFIPEEYYTIEADFKEFKALLKKYKDKDIEIKSKEEADKIINSLSNAYNIYNIEKKVKPEKSDAPFTTSTLQQMSLNRLGFPSRKTMMIAQKLYEGVDLGSERTGLISYMRTDSIRLSDVFVSDTMSYISSNYGKEYIGYVKSAKSKDNVQDAHEAIRPTSIHRTPESVKKYLSSDEFKLYSLIYYRTLASLMADAMTSNTTIDLENNDYIFRATGKIYTFDGYLKVYKDYKDVKDTVLPDFDDNVKVLVSQGVEAKQHFTEPKPRYTEASLIKEMEKNGIGRPSTYATIIERLKDGYVTVKDKKFFDTSEGEEVSDKLEEFFHPVVNIEYTAEMEKELDDIADGKVVWNEMLSSFWNKFEPMYSGALKDAEKVKPEETGDMCPECGNPLVIRKGKFGEFVACSNYPECKYIKKEEKEVKEIMDCPICKKGKIIEKKTRKGKIFYGCSNYPTCKVATWDIPTGDICSKCGSLLVTKNNKVFCSNKDCDFGKEKED